MYHTVEFTAEFTADLETSPKHPLKQVRILTGTRCRAQVKPYVVEGEEGPLEVADLFFEDGTATRQVRFDRFRFLDTP